MMIGNNPPNKFMINIMVMAIATITSITIYNCHSKPVKVCDICGDPGYADLLVVCNECGEVAEHVYCMQTLLECDSQVYWSCEECNVKQRTSEQKMAVTLPRPQVAQSQPQSSKRQGDDPSSPPASKKQAIKSSNAVAYQSEVILQRDNSFVVSKATNADNCGKSQQTCSSVRPLHSEDGLSKAPGAGKVENGSTALVQACNGSVLPPLPRETSVKTVEIPKVKFLPVSSSANFSGGLRGTVTTGSVDRESGTVNKLGSQSSSHLGSANPGLLSPGSKSAMLAKSGDPLPSFLLSSRPAISPRGQAALRSSKDGVSGSGQLSLPSQSSGLKPSGGKFRGSNATVCALASPIPDSEQQNDGHPGKLSMNVDVKGIKEPSGNSNCVTGEKCDVDLNAVPLISLSENCRPKEAFLSTKENTHFTSTSVEVRSPTVCENAKGFRLTSEDMKGSVMPKMPLERLVQTKGLESANEGPKVLESIKMDTEDCGFDKDPKGLVSLEVDKEDSKVLILSREKAVDLTLTGEDQTIFPLLKQDMKGLSISSKDPLHLLENEFRDSVSAKDDFERSMPVCKDPKSNGENIEEASVKASCHQNIQSAECLHKTGVFSQNELKSACNIRAPQTNETTGAVPEFNLSRNATSCALTSFDLSPPSGVIDGSVQGMDQTPKLHKSYMGRVSSSAAPAVQQTSTNRAHESINSSIERETERGTSNITLAAWNNTTQRPTKQNATSFVDMGNNLLKAGPPVAPRTFGRERVVAARKGHSTTRHSEMNLASSLAMQNQTSNPKERANMSGNLSSSTNISSRTPLKGALLRLPQQKPLTLPQSQILWNGTFKVIGKVSGRRIYDGIRAHPSNTAALKVYEVTKTFQSQLCLQQVPRSDAWPKRFQESPPTDDNIGLYFFPAENKRCQKFYSKLVNATTKHDLAMRMYLENAELLIFSSVQLPEHYRTRLYQAEFVQELMKRVERITSHLSTICSRSECLDICSRALAVGFMLVVWMNPSANLKIDSSTVQKRDSSLWLKRHQPKERSALAVIKLTSSGSVTGSSVIVHRCDVGLISNNPCPIPELIGRQFSKNNKESPVVKSRFQPQKADSREKAPSVKELQGAFTQSNVEANVLGPGSTLPLRSNIEDSVSRELKLPNMDGNDGGEENMDIDMEGGKDVGIPERPVPRPDNQIERASARHSSKLSLPLDSKRNSNQPSSILFSQQEDAKAGGPMLFECDQSLPVPSRVESERTLERMNEQVSRMSSEKSIDLTQERACLGGTKKELDEPSGLDLSSQICHPQVRHQSSSRRSLEVMPDRGNGGGPQKRLHKKELPHHIGSPKGSQVLEGKDILKGAGPQGQNYQSGIDSQYQEFPPCSDLAGCNPLQSPTDHSHEKHGSKHFQDEVYSKAEAQKEMDAKVRQLACSRQEGRNRKYFERPHNSHQSSLSSGRSNYSYGAMGRSLSPPLAPAKRQADRSEAAPERSKTRTEEQHFCSSRRVKEGGRERHRKNRKRMERDKESGSRRHSGRRVRHMENQRRGHASDRGNSHSRSCSRSRSRSCSISHSCSQLPTRSCSPSRGRCRSLGEGNIMISRHPINSSDTYSHDRRSRHDRPSLEIDSPSEGQIDVRNCIGKGKAPLEEDNCMSGRREMFLEKRIELEASLPEVEEGCSTIRSREASGGQDQTTKDQWSFTPLENRTDEAAENRNVSEVTNDASLLESSEQMFSGENIPQELMEADISGRVNARIEHTSKSRVDLYLTGEQGSWCSGSSSRESDLEHVTCLSLFPLEEENLGMVKNIDNDWDIDLDLGLGRRTSKKGPLSGFKQSSCQKDFHDLMEDNEACPSGPNDVLEGSSDAGPLLSLSPPSIKKEKQLLNGSY
eukprot:Gb_19412 [translate_table: standard]